MPRNRKKALPANTVNIIISIIIAIILWAYVIAEVNPVTQQTMAGIPVQLLNTDTITDRGLALAGVQTFTVDVVLEGKRRDAVKVTPDEIVANADLSGFGTGENLVPVVVAVPEGMTILEIKPSKIKVEIEELITASKPVKIEYVGTAPNGSEPGSISLDPLTVDVTGAKSAVNAVTSVVASINMSDLTTNTKTIQVPALPADSDGNKVENVQISAGNINVTGKMLNTKEVKLNVEIIGQLNPIYEIKFINVPSTVKIKGDAGQLTAIASILAEPIDISTLKVTSKLPIKLIFPAGIEAAAGSEALTAEVGIQELTSRRFDYTVSEIGVQGLDSTLKASVKAIQISVTASGSQDIISGLTKADIEPYVDLTGSVAGVGNVPIKLTYTKQIDSIVIDPAEVFVEITQ